MFSHIRRYDESPTSAQSLKQWSFHSDWFVYDFYSPLFIKRMRVYCFFLYLFKFVLNSKVVLSASESECLRNENVRKIYPAEVFFFIVFFLIQVVFIVVMPDLFVVGIPTNTSVHSCISTRLTSIGISKGKKACWCEVISQMFQTNV